MKFKLKPWHFWTFSAYYVINGNLKTWYFWRPRCAAWGFKNGEGHDGLKCRPSTQLLCLYVLSILNLPDRLGLFRIPCNSSIYGLSARRWIITILYKLSCFFKLNYFFIFRRGSLFVVENLIWPFQSSFDLYHQSFPLKTQFYQFLTFGTINVYVGYNCGTILKRIYCQKQCFFSRDS